MCNPKLIFLNPTKTYVACFQKNRLNETVLLSTQNMLLVILANVEKQSLLKKILDIA